jgi:2-desacetyl-2-hydroxyethyl bacteriochlorophyllide A dehydrogenase
MKAKRVVFPAKRRCELEEFDVPERPDGNQVLVESRASLISAGTEMGIYTGAHSGVSDPENRFAKYPFHPGYATAGVVLATGPQTSLFKPGDAVLVQEPHATHAVCDEQELVPIPEGVSLEQAPLARLAAISLHGVRMANIHLGESALVMGQGLIGLCATLAAHLEGARPLLAVDLDESRLKLARTLGADAGLNPSRGPLGEAVGKVLNGGKVEHLIVATAVGSVVPQAMALLRPCGNLILLGGAHGVVEMDLYKTIHRRAFHVIGAHEGGAPASETPYFRWTMRNNLICVLNLMARREFDPGSLITQSCGPDGVAALFESAAESPQTHLGMIIRWT